MLHFGEQIKTVRQARGYSLEFVQEQCSIHIAWLAALEEGQFELLSDEATALQAAGRYAAFLGMCVKDAEEDFIRSMRSYRQTPLAVAPGITPGQSRARRSEAEAHPAPDSFITYNEPQPARRLPFRSFIPGGIPLKNIAAAAVFLIAVIWIGSSFVAPFIAGQISGSSQQAPALTGAINIDDRLEGIKQTQPSRSEEPKITLGAVHEPSAMSSVQSSQGLVLELNARQDCWIKLVVDGQADYEGILASGESRKIQAKEVIKLKTSNAGSLGVTYNGQALKAIGGANEVVEKEFR